MNDELDIIVVGFELDQRQVEAGLVRVFGIDPQQARRLLRELPATAKRGAPLALAERYVAALRSIGARVETRPAEQGRPVARAPAAGSSLPAPPPSVVARARESQRVQRETERAIKRFRAAEGLDSGEPEGPGIDLFNPAIPKAPPLPHDLARMPNAAPPRFSDRPQWMLTDPLAEGADVELAREHVDAQPPPPIPPQAPSSSSSAPALRGGASTPPRRDIGLESVPPRAVGLAHSATASIRPGLSSLHDIRRPGRARVRWRALWPVGIAVLVLAIAGLYFAGVFDSRIQKRERAWRAQGIEPGQSAEALTWLEGAGHEVRGMPRPALLELIERLTRAGALGVYVIELESTALGQRAGGLLVELPDSPGPRATVFFHLAKVPGQRPATEADHGQRFHTLSLR